MPSTNGHAAQRGICTRDAGAELAEATLESIYPLVHAAMGENGGALTTDSLALSGLLNRIVGFHEGAAREIAEDNPFGAFTLLRAHAETVAVLLHLTAAPDDIKRFHLGAGVADRFNIGRLIHDAAKGSPNFKAIYEQLSGFAHPSYVGANTSMRVKPGRRIEWQSKPQFHSEDDAHTAYLWLVELTEAGRDLWVSLYRAYHEGLESPEV